MTTPSSVLTPEQDEYLREHRLGVLGTGRQDGSPALATVLYDYNGTDIVTSMIETSAKWRNALRQPRVALAVLDGRKQLVAYGRAEAQPDGPGRLEAMRRIRAKMRRREGEPEPDDAALEASMDAEGRVVLRITPDRVLMND